MQLQTLVFSRNNASLRFLSVLASVVVTSCSPQGDKSAEPFGYVSPIEQLRHEASEAGRAKHYAEAIEIHKKILGLLPEGHYEREWQWSAIADHYENLGKIDEMIKVLEERGEHYKASDKLAQLGRRAEAAEMLVKCMQSTGRFPSNWFLNAVQYYRETGNAKRAYEIREEYVKHHPECLPDYELSELHFLLKRPALAKVLGPHKSLTGEHAAPIRDWAIKEEDAEAAAWAAYLGLTVLECPDLWGVQKERRVRTREEVRDFCKQHSDSDLSLRAMEELAKADARALRQCEEGNTLEIALEVLAPTRNRFPVLSRCAESWRSDRGKEAVAFLRELLEQAKEQADVRCIELALVECIAERDKTAPEIFTICTKIIGDPSAPPHEKAAALRRLNRSFLYPQELAASESLVQRIKANFAPNDWPAAYFISHADLMRRNLKRTEAVEFLKSFLQEAPDHQEAAEVTLALGHHCWARDPALYEKHLLLAAFHPRQADPWHHAQERAKEELAAFYEEAGRFRDAARILERLSTASFCGTCARGAALTCVLQVLSVKSQFMEPQEVLEAMWETASQWGSEEHDAQCAAFYLVTAYQQHGRYKKLHRLAKHYAHNADKRHADYAKALPKAIDRRFQQLQVLKAEPATIVTDLVATEGSRPSLIHPSSLPYSRGYGLECVRALRRFPKETVAPLLQKAFEKKPGNDWLVMAMAENGDPKLIATLLNAAKYAAEKRQFNMSAGAIAYSGVPGAEDRMLALQSVRPDGKEIIGDALAYLADLRERKASGTPSSRHGQREQVARPKPEPEPSPGVDVSARDERGRMPLHRAAMQQHEALARLLIANGADVNATDNGGSTPLHHAGSGTIALLVAKGADVNAKDRRGMTALHWAALRGEKAVVEALVAVGADTNAKEDEAMMTPLHAALSKNHTDIAAILIAKGADVNARITMGWTPLHYAASGGHADIAELLIHGGADVNAKDNEGFTPLSCAEMQAHDKVAAHLRQHGGKTGSGLDQKGAK